MKIVGKYLIRIILLLSLVSSLLFFHFEKLKSFFLTNQTLNSIILAVLAIGIIFILKQLFNLSNELSWLNNVTKQSSTTKLSARSPRLIESREISRYMIGLTIFLGLLGTFWGLLETINSVSTTVSSLDFSENTQKLFKVLKEGLEKPLGGMGTAFSSSLFGLGGSLILGFLDLQSNQAQNRFYNEIEEKLAERTKFSLMNMDNNEKKNLAPAYIESLIEVTTENLKKSTAVIEKQNSHQESISKSILDINRVISENTSLNKDIKEEIKVLSKTIANISKR